MALKPVKPLAVTSISVLAIVPVVSTFMPFQVVASPDCAGRSLSFTRTVTEPGNSSKPFSAAKLTIKASTASSILSSAISMKTVCDVSPRAKVTVPDGNSALLKSSASIGLPLVGVAVQEMVKSSPAGASRVISIATVGFEPSVA